MDKQKANQMLEKTFKESFNSEIFIQFIKELFNKLDIHEKKCEPNDIHNDFREYIESYSLLGKYKDSDKKAIEILTVKLRRPSSMDLARTMQRNFIARYLIQRNVNAALVVFYGEETDNWRFSFVKLEYNLEEDENGNIIPAKNITPPKRYSFLVGKTEPSHTAQSRFLELLIKEDSNPTVLEIESAFSVEKVTKEFFEKYKKLFLELEESLNKIVKHDKDLAKEFTKKGISTVDFTKKLLGQIVFLYFLQKKGWLGIEKDENGKFKGWGSGSKNFLKKLYNKDIVKYDNFFNDILESLFYEALAIERENDYYSRFRCKIPFLNGGLFEPLGGYNWTNIDILLDNKIFGKIFETFDLYNFTVKEDEPLEKEVAIDPEMLGKVFENLLGVKDRKSTGSFYTPREIVHYMCQESLINYIKNGVNIEHNDIMDFVHNETISKSIGGNYELIDKLLKEIKVTDPACGSGAFLVGMMTEIVKLRVALTRLYHKNKQTERIIYNLKRECIEESIYGVDIDSSAVDIAQLRLWLSLIVDESNIHNVKPLPNLDYKIMCGNSLLEEFNGIKLFDEQLLEINTQKDQDRIQEIEIQMAKLGLELRQISLGHNKGKHKDIEKRIKKLQKQKKDILNYMEDTDSQVTLEQSIQKKTNVARIKFKELERLHHVYFNEHNRKIKIEMRKDIEKLEWEFIEETLKEQGNNESIQKIEQYRKTRSKPFFLWKLYFAEVFQRENPGFDVVIANPPYVRMEEIKEYKESLKQNYRVFSSTADLYTYFYEKGINIIREHAILTFISSNKFMRAKYGIHLRNFLKHNTSIREVIDFGDKHLFEAITNTVVVITKKGYNEYNEVMFSDNITKKSISSIHQDNLDESAWTLAKKEVLELKEKVEKKGMILKDWNVDINRGVLTGLNEAFIIDTKTKEKICKEDSKNKEIIKPIIRGRDIEKYYYKLPDLWLIATFKQNRDKFKISDYPIIEKHLSQFKNNLEPRPNNWSVGKKWSGRNTQPFDYLWYENFFVPNLENFKKEKVIWIELTNENRFAYSTKEEYVLAGAFLMTGESLKYLLAFLNSKICKFYFKLICNSSGMGTVQWKKFAMEKIPIPKLLKKDEQPFIKIVDQILDITKDDDYLKNPDKQAKVKKLEKEIDQLVYKLYELTPEEIEIVEDGSK